MVVLTGIERIVNGGRVHRVVTPNLECTGSRRSVGALGEMVVVEQWHGVVLGIVALVRWGEGTYLADFKPRSPSLLPRSLHLDCWTLRGLLLSCGQLGGSVLAADGIFEIR